MGQHLRHMTPEQIRASMLRIRHRGITIEQPEVRKLTGGYASQSINHYVMRRLHDQLQAQRLVPRVRPFNPTEQVD